MSELKVQWRIDTGLVFLNKPTKVYEITTAIVIQVDF